MIAAAYFGFHWWTYRQSHSITDDAFVEAHIVNVAPEMVSGRIVRFHAEENDCVEQGQVLAEIEPVHYRDQVEQARGKLDLASAELKRQEAGLTKLKKEVPLQIDVAKQTLAGARTEVTFHHQLPEKVGELSVHLHGAHNRTQFDGQPGGLTGAQPFSAYCNIARDLSPSGPKTAGTPLDAERDQLFAQGMDDPVDA